MDYQLNQEREMEIDLKSVLWKLLSQWKTLLVFALLMAILVCGIKHHRDIQEYKNKIQTMDDAARQAALSLDERIDAVLETLPQDERSDVVLVVSEKEWLAYQKNYLNESVLLQTDPSNQRILRIVFDIDSESAADLPVLLNNYSMYLHSDAVISGIKEYINPNADNKYIEELFYYGDEDDGSQAIISESAALEVNIVLPEDTDAYGVANVMSDALSSYRRELQSKYPHSITLAGVEDTHTYSTYNVEKRKDLFSNIYNTENLIKVKEANLSKAQAKAVETILKLKSENGTEPEITIAPGLSKKYALLGFVIGLVIYVFMYFTWVILRGSFNSASEVENYTQKRVFGEIYCKNDGAKRIFRSNHVLERQHGDKLDKAVQIEKISKTLSAMCEHEGSDKVALIRTDAAKDVCDITEELSAAINECGIDMQLLDIMSNGFDEAELLSVKKAVLAIEQGTKGSTIGQVLKICKDYSIDILGSVYIEA